MSKTLTKKYKIVIADDHNIFRAGLKSLIEKNELFDMVGEAQDGQDLVAKLNKIKCDLVVLDLSMPNMDGEQAMKFINRRFPKIKVLVLTMQKDPLHFQHAMANGACGYVLKDDAYEQLVTAIQTIMDGKQFVSPSMKTLLADIYSSVNKKESSNVDVLTKREQQVLRLIATGLANKNIARKLEISIRTVEVHRSNLIRKLGIKTTAGLVKYALSKGFI